MQHETEITLNKVHRLLFDAVRSLPEAQNYFEGNLDNSELLQVLFEVALSESSDAVRVQASFYISQYPPHLLANHEEYLLKLQDDAWESVSDHAIIALAKIISKKGFENLVEKRIAPKMAWEAKALRYYVGAMKSK